MWTIKNPPDIDTDTDIEQPKYLMDRILVIFDGYELSDNDIFPDYPRSSNRISTKLDKPQIPRKPSLSIGPATQASFALSQSSTIITC